MGANGETVIKILHVVMALDVGGLETWLLKVLQNLDHRRFQIDILVHYPEKGLLEDQAAELSKVLRLPHLSNPLYYAREFRQLLLEHGPYQVVHSHLALGGFHLRWALQVGVPVRIVHTHSDEDQRAHHLSLPRRLARKVSHHQIRCHATVGLAVSRQAAQGRFGPHWQDDPRFQILPCAIPLDAFTGGVDRSSVRQALNLPESAFVMGHVGRFVPEKNHDLLIEIAAEVCQRLPEVYLLLVGDGPLHQQLEDKVQSLGLTTRVVFLGFRHDVPEILRGAMDLFLFPSRYEAAPVAVMEAQAAGLPCVIADTIPEEVVVIPELVQRVSLNAGPGGWVEAVLDARSNTTAMTPFDAAGRMRGTLLDLDANVRHLEALYMIGQRIDCRPIDDEIR